MTAYRVTNNSIATRYFPQGGDPVTRGYREIRTPGNELGEDLAKWLRASMRRPEGARPIELRQIEEDAGIGRAILWLLAGGKAGGAKRLISQDTLNRIAAYLKVPAPQIVTTLVVAGGKIPQPSTPLEMIAEAQALLEAATVRLRDSAQPVARPSAAEVADALKAVKAGEATLASSAKPRRRKKPA